MLGVGRVQMILLQGAPASPLSRKETPLSKDQLPPSTSSDQISPSPVCPPARLTSQSTTPVPLSPEKTTLNQSKVIGSSAPTSTWSSAPVETSVCQRPPHKQPTSLPSQPPEPPSPAEPMPSKLITPRETTATDQKPTPQFKSTSRALQLRPTPSTPSTSAMSPATELLRTH